MWLYVVGVVGMAGERAGGRLLVGQGVVREPFPQALGSSGGQTNQHKRWPMPPWWLCLQLAQCPQAHNLPLSIRKLDVCPPSTLLPAPALSKAFGYWGAGARGLWRAANHSPNGLAQRAGRGRRPGHTGLCAHASPLPCDRGWRWGQGGWADGSMCAQNPSSCSRTQTQAKAQLAIVLCVCV